MSKKLLMLIGNSTFAYEKLILNLINNTKDETKQHFYKRVLHACNRHGWHVQFMYENSEN